MLRLRRLQPLFPRQVERARGYSKGTDRTNNEYESWNAAFNSLVGHPHPSLWVLIQALQRDQALTSHALDQSARQQQPAKRVKRSTVELRKKLLQHCKFRRDGLKPVSETINAVRHTICVSR